MAATVLIIDDEEAVAWALRKACERQGYRAVVCATAEDGLLVVAVTPPARLASRLVETVEWAGGTELLAAWAASDWPELKAEAVAALNRTKK